MSDKLYIQDLVHLLSEKQNISRKEAETFLKVFFSLIEEGLDKDKSVKIKGLGTFKLIRVESRESVDVNTGKRCIIEGHTKVSFNPDAIVKDFINKPFSHFETVILNENVFFDEEESKDKSDSERREVIEVVPVSEEIKTDKPVEEVTQQELVVDIEPKPTETNDMVEYPETANTSEEEVVKVNDTDDTEKEVVAIEPAVDEKSPEPPSELPVGEVLQKENNNEVIVGQEQSYSFVSQEVEQLPDVFLSSGETDEPEIKEGQEKEKIAQKYEVPSFKKEQSNLLAYICIACVTAFITVCIVYFIFYPDIFNGLLNGSTAKSSQQAQELIEQPVSVEQEISAEIVDEEEMETEEEREIRLEEEHAFIHNEQIEEERGENISQPQDLFADTTKTIITGVRKGYDNVKADSTSYRIVGTMATHTIRGGETLTKVANTYYGTKDLWPYLVMHNRKIITNPDNVPSGTTIRIPALRDK